MVTTLFLIIAYLRRKQFLAPGTPTSNKALYYILNVPLTPIFGPILYTWITKSKNTNTPTDSIAPPTTFTPHSGLM